MIHPTAEVERGAQVGADTRIWHFVHVRTGAKIGANCTLGYNVFVDRDVVIGNNVKLQNRVSLFRGVTLEDGVFVGPHATFTNDTYPRSITPDGRLLDHDDWPAVADAGALRRLDRRRGGDHRRRDDRALGDGRRRRRRDARRAGPRARHRQAGAPDGLRLRAAATR